MKLFISSVVTLALLCSMTACVYAPLTTAAGNGDVNSVRSLLDQGANINEANGGTALAHACWAGHIEVVKLLIDRGADLNLRYTYMGSVYSPLVWAAQKGRTEVAKLLIAKGADIDQALRDLYTTADTMDVYANRYPDDVDFSTTSAEIKRGIKLIERLQAEYSPQVQQNSVPSSANRATHDPDYGGEKTPTDHYDVTQKLLEAKKLLDENIITREEYDAIKAKLLPSILQN